MKLETDRLILRRWKESDKIPFRAINQDRRVMEFFPETRSDEESDRTIENIEKFFEQNGFGLFAAEKKEDKKFIGFVGIQKVGFETHFTPAVEIGWRIAFEHWGKGYAPEAAKEVLRFGFENIGLKEIIALTVPANQRSRRVMEKLGMIYDPKGDFENPRLPEGHPLRPHILYRLRSS